LHVEDELLWVLEALIEDEVIVTRNVVQDAGSDLRRNELV